MIREILVYPSKELRMISSPAYPIKKLEILIQDMKDTMYAAHGVGLAAPQIGILRRLIVVDFAQLEGNRNPIVLANPKVIPDLNANLVSSEEGCLSVPGKAAEVKRFDKIEIVGKIPFYPPNGEVEFKPFKETFEGFPAFIFQHEIDHLEGKLFFDRLSYIKKDMYVRKLNKSIKRGEAWRSQLPELL